MNLKEEYAKITYRGPIDEILSKHVKRKYKINTQDLHQCCQYSFDKGYDLSKKELGIKKGIIAYLEDFIEFCKCGNPKADCICP